MDTLFNAVQKYLALATSSSALHIAHAVNASVRDVRACLFDHPDTFLVDENLWRLKYPVERPRCRVPDTVPKNSRMELLDLLRSFDEPVTSVDLARITGATVSATDIALLRLERTNLVERVSPSIRRKQKAKWRVLCAAM